MNASRTEKTKDTYWTPAKILDLARSVRGAQFALDPATDPRNPTRAAHYAVAPEWGEGDRLADFAERFEVDVTNTPHVDGLAQDWTALAAGGMVWVNPPFGREKISFLVKAHEEAKKGCEIQMITPCDPATAWWQRFCSPRLIARTAPAVCYLRQRVTFLDPETGRPPVDKHGEPTGAMFGSQILYWGRNHEAFYAAWAKHGDVDMGPGVWNGSVYLRSGGA